MALEKTQLVFEKAQQTLTKAQQALETQVEPIAKTHSYLSNMRISYYEQGSDFYRLFAYCRWRSFISIRYVSTINNLFDNQKATAEQIKSLNIQVTTINDHVKSSSDISKSLIKPIKAVLEGINLQAKSMEAFGEFQTKMTELLTLNIDTVTKINNLLSTHDRHRVYVRS